MEMDDIATFGGEKPVLAADASDELEDANGEFEAVYFIELEAGADIDTEIVSDPDVFTTWFKWDFVFDW
jgi:hypothetical protein